ncbi:ankyrin repeat domain-containing protein [Luteibacter aegosomaticola]|uniref:ankyrin repeat domain-containing protein n=1 Tax=Luteibacter aegosomaticola TaxID=2911538 RepID=UPI001FFB617A|nr:ankyrin repeat domain-containing protein [Luteibacter aegosomaticola]UPG88289.1 ankyrin repeat domain-containing protein [Luteibacter aegosomaticola]
MNQRALCDAAWTGDIDVVRKCILNPAMRRVGDVDTALLHASHRGHARIAELLLGVGANPLRRNSECLWRAACHGRGSVVRLLLPLSDTSRWERWQWEEISPTMQKRLGYLSS